MRYTITESDFFALVSGDLINLKEAGKGAQLDSPLAILPDIGFARLRELIDMAESRKNWPELPSETSQP